MKKKDVQLGGVYVAKVSGRLAPVRITRESPYGGWEAVNVKTGRSIRVRSAARLRRPVASKPLAIGTRVAVNIGQGLAKCTGTVVEARYDDGWLYRIEVADGDRCEDHRNEKGELWVCHFEVKPLPT